MCADFPMISAHRKRYQNRHSVSDFTHLKGVCTMGIAALLLVALLVLSFVSFVVRIFTGAYKFLKSIKVNWKRYWIVQLVLVLVVISSLIALVTIGGFALVGLFI